jgi:hypothetical protein
MPPKMFSPFGPLNIFGSTPAWARNSSLSEPSELKAWSAASLACDNKPASAPAKPAAPTSTFTLPDPDARIKSVLSVKGGASDQVSDPATGIQYYLYPTSPTTAQWYSVPKGSTLATPVNPKTLAATGDGMTLKTLTSNRQAFYQANPTGTAQRAMRLHRQYFSASKAKLRQHIVYPLALIVGGWRLLFYQISTSADYTLAF